MNKHNKKSLIVFTALCVILTGILYTTDFQTTAVAAAPKIQLNKKSITLTRGKSTTLKIKGTKKKAKWSSANKKIAIINQKGKVTAKKKGSTKITARIGKKKYLCKIKVIDPKPKKSNPHKKKPLPETTPVPTSTVLPPAPTIVPTIKPTIEVSSITLNQPSKTLYIGDSFFLETAIYPENASNKTITWNSSNEAIAVVQDGWVNALSPGSAVITAQSGSCSAECELTVKEIEISSIVLNKSSKAIYVGDSFSLQASIYPDNASDKSVTWSSDNEAVATVRDGLVNAVSSGNAIITAQAGTCLARCRITVKNIEVSSITLNESSKTLYVGDSFSLQASIYPDNASDKSVTWSSDNGAVATVQDGLVNAVSSGNAIITAQAGTCLARCRITVKNIEVSSITLNESSKTLYVGDSFSLQASIYPDNASDKSVTWSSDNGAVATVQDGLVNAVSSGNAIITARAGTRLARCRITVNKKINEYTMGETWEVADQWRFTINSVTTHYKCNNYSDKTGEQVILINYSYYNTGYEGSTQDLFFYGMENVYDENGTAASRYPCTHTKHPDVCLIGTNCTASCSYILPHASTNIKVYIEHRTSNGLGKEKAIYNLQIPEPFLPETPAPATPTPTPPSVMPDYEKNAERLKSYIIDNGLTDNDGYKYVETTMIQANDTQGKITYIPDNDIFIFSIKVPDHLTGTSLIYYSLPDTKVTSVECSFTWNINADYNYTAQSTMDINTYTQSTDLKFSAVDGNPSLVDQKSCNQTTLLNLLTADTFLLVNLNGMSLADLGFSAF